LPDAQLTIREEKIISVCRTHKTDEGND
jgi:hypothetical protein